MEQREAERKAFGRAWNYLSYHAAAKWTSLLAGAGTGLLYVVLLVLLWLFADLMVHRGTLPSYAELTRPDQERFQDYWKALPEDKQKEYLEGIGLPEPVAEPLASAAQANFDELSPTRQALVWRSFLSDLLRQRVSGTAEALVLPAFRDLPVSEQEAFAAWWRQWPDKGATFSEELKLDPSLSQELDRPDLDFHKLSSSRQELAWRTSQYHLLHSRKDFADSQAASVVEQHIRAQAADESAPPPGAENTALANHGLLSLVARCDIRYNLLNPGSSGLARANPYRAGGPVLGWLVSWNPPLWRWGNLWCLIELLVLAVLVGLLEAVLTYVLQTAAALATTEASSRLRRAVYHHTFRLGTLAFRALGPGEAATIFTRHVEAVHDALYLATTVVFRQPIKFVLLLVLALLIHPLLAVAFLLFAALIWLIGTQVAATVGRQGQQATKRAGEQLTLIRESLMLMRLVKCYLMELFNQSRVERQLARYAASQLHRYRGEAFHRALLGFLGLLASVCLLFAGGLIVLHDQLSVASAITLAVALISLYWPLQSLLENRRHLRRGKASAVALFQFLDRPAEVGQVVGAEFLHPLSQELEFDNVSLREPGSGRMLLQDVSLTIKAGQRIGIVGQDDLEKHALVYLIPRFLDPTSGEIRIDQHNLRWITLDSLRAQTALVMMHNLVFHDSVANNIGCGDPAYTLPQIIEAAKTAHAHHFIQRLPRGYETPIGELGHSLNLSEQFRIALARAILRDPALLIVEEPETAMDEDVKTLLDDTLTRILPRRTAIFLPHRISTLKSCDQIFLLHRGKLEAIGDHRDLLSHNRLYRHLHYLEFNEMAEQV